MRKLGKYELPDFAIEDAISTAKTLEKVLMGKEAPKKSFAAALGQSANSGAFFVKLADLRRYGLVSGRGDNYQTTELARRLAYEKDPVKYQEAVRDLVFNTPLYKDLYDHFQGIEADQVQFEIALQQITGEHPENIKKYYEEIRRIYNDIARNINMLKQTTQQPQTTNSTQQQTITSNLEITKANEEGVLKLYYGKKGKLELEESADNIQLLIGFLESYKKKITDKDESS